MARPLVISDCDEVLLHMVTHFKEWIEAEQGIDFALDGTPFVDAMRKRGSDSALTQDQVVHYLDLFFESEMHRQNPIAGAVESLEELQREADVVILTNIADRFGAGRSLQLRNFGIDVPVYTNQGPKGPAVKRLVEQYGAQRAVFIDDIARHHASVLEEAPHVARLHFCGEPVVATTIPCAQEAGHANARIDNWDQALPWIQQTLSR